MSGSELRIESLHVYPIKSCAGISLAETVLQKDGIALDRRWMIVDENGKFITQREHPKLAQVQVSLSPDPLKPFEIQLQVGVDQFQLPSESLTSLKQVQVWKNELVASIEDENISKSLSDFLSKKVSLVRYRPESPRPSPNARFADSRPLLLVSKASLQDLNSKLLSGGSSLVPVDRFRANIVVNGQNPFEEDHWERLQVGPAEFKKERLCTRCIMINVDQKTGEMKGPQPLKILSSYRRKDNGVCFGVMYRSLSSETLKVGDFVKPLELL